MAIVTVDTLVEGTRRDDVYAWLSDVSHHEKLLKAGFLEVRAGSAPDTWSLTIPVPVRPVVVIYRFRAADDAHGGRRVLVELDGVRTRGELHFSMRTMKPSTNTLVTLHADYQSGRLVGPLIDKFFLEKAMRVGMSQMLEALARALRAGGGVA
jgi:hypothetical protein